MKVKRMICLGVFISGAICVMFALHWMQKAYETKKNGVALADASDRASMNAVMGRVLPQKAGENDLKLVYLLGGGMLLLASSSGMLLFLRNR